MMSFTFASMSCLANSSAVYNGLTVVQIPPNFMTARNMKAYSGTFGLYIARTSPFLNPVAYKPAASRWMDSDNSR